MITSEIAEKLKKLVNVANLGVGGEREAAKNIIQKICTKYGLKYQDVMAGKFGADPHKHEPFDKAKREYEDIWDDLRNVNSEYERMWQDLGEKYSRKQEAAEEAGRKARQEAWEKSHDKETGKQHVPRVFMDKMGGMWTEREVMFLSNEKKIHLFGTAYL